MKETLPDGLAEIPPGLALGAVLAATDSASVSDEDFGDALQAEFRQLCHQQGRFLDRVAALADRAKRVAARSGHLESAYLRIAAEELAAEFCFGYRYARRLVADAEAVRACPPVAAALRVGRIDQVRAVLLVSEPSGLTDAQIALIVAELLPQAGRLSIAELRARIRRRAIALDPGWAQRKFKDSVAQRRVYGYLADDGTAVLGASGLSPAEAQAAAERIEDLARAAKALGYLGTADHARADLYLGLLDGRFDGLSRAQIIDALITDHLETHPDSTHADPETAAAEPAGLPRPRGAELQLRLSTALGLDDQPAEVAGIGPVTAEEACRLLTAYRHAQWRYVICNQSGAYLRHGILRARPDLPWSRRQTVDGIVELQLRDTDLTTLAASAPAEWAGFVTTLIIDDTDRQAVVTPSDTARRFPTQHQRREVQLRDRSCMFPGHWTPARRSEIDHTRDHALGGPTDPDNLKPPCKRHHIVKSKGWWRYRVLLDGSTEWTSALGRVHIQPARKVIDDLPPPAPRPPEPSRDEEPENDGEYPILEPPPERVTSADEPPPF